MKFNRHQLPHQQRGVFLLAAGTDFRRVAPDSFPLLPVGEWNGFTNMGTQKAQKLTITEPMLQAAVAYQQRRLQLNPDKKLVIDYEHQSLSGDLAPAAGWISGLAIKDGWLWATGVEWTEKAKGFIENGEYKYYSPMFAFNYRDKVSGETVPLAVFGAGLTNEPFLDEVEDLGLLQAAKSNQPKLYQLKHNNHEETIPMNTLLALLASLFGVAATSEENVFVAKANGFIDQLKQLGVSVKDNAELTAEAIVNHFKGVNDELKALKANYAQVAKAIGAAETDGPEKIIALSARTMDTNITALRSQVTTLENRLAERDVDDLLAGALAKGKISPAMKEHYKKYAMKDREGFVAMMAATPEYSAVPLNRVETPGAVAAAHDENGQPSVETIQAYADKNKLSFKDAAIALTVRKN